MALAPAHLSGTIRISSLQQSPASASRQDRGRLIQPLGLQSPSPSPLASPPTSPSPSVHMSSSVHIPASVRVSAAGAYPVFGFGGRDPTRSLAGKAKGKQQRQPPLWHQGHQGVAQGVPAKTRIGKRGGSKARAVASLKEQATELVHDLRGTSIFLIGMMGCGKSTVGKILADALGYCFFDSDSVVEQAAGGASVSQIFQENGEDAFRNLETSVLSELSSLGRVVVSTGGGAILRPTNWSFLSHGITVFIDVPVPVLAARVLAAGKSSRPLLTSAPATSADTQTADAQSAEDGELLETIARLQGIYDQRSHLYRNADTTISLQEISNSKSVSVDKVLPEQIASKVLSNIGALVAKRKQRDDVIRSRAGA